MKSVIKVIASAALVSMAGATFAGITQPTGAGGQLVVTAAAGGTDFVQTGFNFQTSSGVFLAAAQNSIKFVVAARHQKGRFTYGGDSEGGSVAACEATPSETGFTAAVVPLVTDACAGLS